MSEFSVYFKIFWLFFRMAMAQVVSQTMIYYSTARMVFQLELIRLSLHTKKSFFINLSDFHKIQNGNIRV
jgi:hypothetical protein